MKESKQIKIRKGYKYQVAEDFIVKLKINPGIIYSGRYFKLTSTGWLTIKEGYAYDGASGPTIDTDNTYRAAAVHDVLYQMMREGVLPQSFRKSADLIMYKMLREDGMWYARAKSWYISLRVGAAKHARPSAKKKVYAYP